MNFVPPPYPDDVQEDLGPYSLDEVVVARTSLLHSVQGENSMVWRNIKYKLGILPSGYRMRMFDLDHVWLPPDLPDLWSAPVALHDPTAATGAGDFDTEADRETERKAGEGEGKIGNQEESPCGSGALPTSPEPLPPPGGRAAVNALSRKLLGKRSRKDCQGGVDSRPSAFGAGDGGEHDCQAVGKYWAAEERSAHSSNSRASTSEARSSAGEGGSKLRKKEKGPEEAQKQMYCVVFRCDLCTCLRQNEVDMLRHLHQKGHYSASRYLAIREEGNGELRLVFLSVASLLKEPQYLFHDKVPACPICHSIFASVSQCMSHSLVKHKQYGLYSLRFITRSVTFELQYDTDRCVECGEELQNKDVGAHSKETQHMAIYTGQKTAQPMMIFLCPFCKLTHVDYWHYKTHIFAKHPKLVKPSKEVTATCCMLGKSQPALTMLAKDPGVPTENINYDFSKPPLPDDPSFQGAMTKSKMRRIARKRRGREGLAALRVEKTVTVNLGSEQEQVLVKTAKKIKQKKKKKTQRETCCF